jgi:hypothetical protein
MTRPLPFTQAGLQRALRAATKEQCRVILRPDGSMAFEPIDAVDGDNAPAVLVSIVPGRDTATPSKWGDIEA